MSNPLPLRWLQRHLLARPATLGTAATVALTVGSSLAVALYGANTAPVVMSKIDVHYQDLSFFNRIEPRIPLRSPLQIQPKYLDRHHIWLSRQLAVD